MSKPAFDPADREVWYTDAASGFWVLKLSPSAWPGAGPSSSGASTPSPSGSGSPKVCLPGALGQLGSTLPLPGNPVSACSS